MVLPIEELEEELNIEWDESALAYVALVAIPGIAKAGEQIAHEVVMQALESAITASQANMISLGTQLQQGTITLAEWQTAMMQQIKTLHTMSAAVARGGWAQMSASDWGFVGSEIKKQYDFLKGFAEEIQAGFPLRGRFLERIKLYSRAGRTTASQLFRRLNEDGGRTEERRVLGIADHCSDSAGRPGCLEQAAEGWQPIGTLAPIGGATCWQNCRCHFEYR